MQSKILLYLFIYLIVGIFQSYTMFSLQRSKVTYEATTKKIKAVTDTLETLDNFHIFDSLLARTDTMKYFHLYCMGKDYSELKPRLSIAIADSMITHSRRDNYLRGTIGGFNLRGIIYTYEDEYVKAVTNLKKALEIGNNNTPNIANSIKDKYACTHYYLGDLYFKKNDYKVALEYYKKSLAIFNSYSIKDIQAEDLHFLLTSYAFTTIREDKAYSLYSVGKTYLELDMLDSANLFLSKSLVLTRETKFDRLEAKIYYSISELLLIKKDTLKAREFLYKSLELCKSNNLNEYSIYNYLNLMRLNISQGVFSNIDSFYTNLITLTNQMNMRRERGKTHQLYSEYLILIGRPKDAYNELEKANFIINLLEDEEKSRKFGQQEAGIKYQQQLYDMELQSIKSDAEEKRLTTNLYYTLAVIVLLIIIAMIILLYARKNKQLNKRISKVNDELETVNTQLTELNDTKTKLFRIISHDLKTPIMEFEKGILYLKNNPTQNGSSQSTTYLNELSDSASNINGLLNSLLQWAEAQFNDVVIKKTYVDIDRVVSRTITLFKSQIDDKELQINTNLDIKSIYTDQNILQIIIRNVIHNSIKFTPNGGTITVNVLKEDDFTIVAISDTGQGMSQDQIDAILNNNFYYTNYDVARNGSGIGLRAVKDYITQIEGNLFIESSPNNGTTITIYFP